MVACGGERGPGEPSPRVISIEVVGVAPPIGQAAPFVATAIFTDGSRQTIFTNATWVSSNPAVATVSGTGVVTALNAGIADISITYQGLTRSVSVVIPPELTSSFSRDSI